jgi:deazaflavin-dependent oxidoreductase (nitroreductase family)
MSDFSVPEHLPDWITSHVRTYLESGGREGHMWDSTPMGGPGLLPCLLLAAKGRKTGKVTTLPLLYGTKGGSYVIVASRGGSPEHPGWFLNLQANPEVAIMVGPEKLTLRARVAEGAERDELWQRMVKIYPPYTDYQATTERRIPVVVLDPVE